jgi:signal transduction histidine kinase
MLARPIVQHRPPAAGEIAHSTVCPACDGNPAVAAWYSAEGGIVDFPASFTVVCGFIASRGRGFFVAWCWLAQAVAVADVRITSVSIDGRSVAGSAEHVGQESARPRVRVAAGPRRLEIHFAEVNGESLPVEESRASGQPESNGHRLRYRLDGVDTEWRDAAAEARVILQFVDASGDTVDNADVAIRGESESWRGRPEHSAFSPRSFMAIAPPLSVRVTANFLTHGGNEVVGTVGIDDVVFEVTDPNSGETVRYPVVVEAAGDDMHPLDTPTGWTRRGSRGTMARVRTREEPAPHPILVLHDDDPKRYGNWSMLKGVPVMPGDRVTLSWTCSHSLGIGGECVADYPDLKPGTYWFRAGTFRPGGEPTGNESSLVIEVIVPWYERPVTWLGGGLLGAGAAVAIARSLALRRIKRRLEEVERAHSLERERTRIARDLHDEVGAGLTEIAMQNFWVQREMEGKAPPATLDRVERARQSAVELVRSVDAIVWAVNPANDTLDRFVPYLTHSFEQFLDAAGVRSRLDVPDAVPRVGIEGAVRHSLFLVVREAVNNAVKHARPTFVALAIRIDQGRLLIDVEDDGCGIDPQAVSRAMHDQSRRSGLGNIRRRIEELDGSFEIGGRAAGGTRVAIDVRLPVAVSSAVS